MEKKIWGKKLYALPKTLKRPSWFRKLVGRFHRNALNKKRQVGHAQFANQPITSKSRSKKIPFIFISVVILIGVAIYFLYFSQHLNIKVVNINGISDEEHTRILSLFEEKLINQKIFGVGETDIRKMSTELVSTYKFIGFNKMWPSKIQLDFEKRVPLYVVQASNGIYFVDKDFVITDSVNAFMGYSVQVNYDKELQIGETITDPVLLASLAYVSNDSVVRIQGSEISISLANGGKVLLPKDNSIENYAELSGILQKIIQKYTIENKDIDTIDLRFSKPLIKSTVQ